MKPCLDDNELLSLWTAEADELSDQRAHLAQCPQCTASYDELGREAGLITGALTTAADRLQGRDRSAPLGTYARIGDGLRTAGIFFGAAAFGGATAFALLVALGWHPARASNRLANTTGNAALAETATGNRSASARTAIASNQTGTALSAAGSLYAVDAIASDPLAGLAYGNSLQAANSNAGEDLLFCVPEDDGAAICSSSADQG
jgi:hypothetical protein